MFALIITAAIAVGLFVLSGWLFLSSERLDLKHIVGGVLAGLVGVVLLIAAFGWHEIGAGNVGVVTSFGKVQGQVQPGLVWMTPFLNDVAIMDGRVQSYNFGGDPNAATPGPGIEAFTQENQTATMYGTVNYHIDPAYAADLYQQVGQDYFEKVIHHQADTEIKRDARNYTTDQITAKRDELAQAAVQRLQDDVAPYHIFIDGIFISQIGLPKEYLDSVNNKLIAQQNVLTAQANAQAAAANAQGVADANRITAQGQADANNTLNASLNDNLIRWQAIQKLNPNVSVMMLPSNSNFLLPIPSASPTAP